MGEMGLEGVSVCVGGGVDGGMGRVVGYLGLGICLLEVMGRRGGGGVDG